jgi:hypothetical protein
VRDTEQEKEEGGVHRREGEGKRDKEGEGKE